MIPIPTLMLRGISLIGGNTSTAIFVCAFGAKEEALEVKLLILAPKPNPI